MEMWGERPSVAVTRASRGIYRPACLRRIVIAPEVLSMSYDGQGSSPQPQRHIPKPEPGIPGLVGLRPTGPDA